MRGTKVYLKLGQLIDQDKKKKEKGKGGGRIKKETRNKNKSQSENDLKIVRLIEGMSGKMTYYKYSFFLLNP